MGIAERRARARIDDIWDAYLLAQMPRRRTLKVLRQSLSPLRYRRMKRSLNRYRPDAKD